MIPDVPEGCTFEASLKFYEDLLSNNEDQGVVHIHWHTHRQNPAICWICDRAILCHKIIDLFTKSSPDIETSLVQEMESDSEIEEEDNSYNEPEYDVVDELQPEDSE